VSTTSSITDVLICWYLWLKFSSVWWQAIELSYSLCWNKTQEHAQAHW
jgi:hypothetical protein